MASKRTYWAITALGLGPEGIVDGTGVATANFMKGVQSVGISTTFNLEQVFQLGQLEIYQDVEDIPDIEISIEKVIDDGPLVYQHGVGQATEGGSAEKLGGEQLKLTEIQNNKVDAYFTVQPDTAEAAGDTGTGKDVESYVWCSGMYVSSVSFNFPTDGNFTESVTLVGNHKEWIAGSATTKLVGAPTTPAGLHSGDVSRRHNFSFTNIPASIQPAGATDGFKGDAVISSVSVSTDFGREKINHLGGKIPYHRYVTFPIEVTCDIEVVINDAKAQDVNAMPLADSNVSEEAIRFAVYDDHIVNTDGIQGAGGTLNHTFQLGDKNKLTSITYGGGDTGGANATYSYSYRNFNKLDIWKG
tara:strand:+ start:564 stop:1637 length:1074 start_codon:yes stop_codon:yes gene_type:complete